MESLTKAVNPRLLDFTRGAAVAITVAVAVLASVIAIIVVGLQGSQVTTVTTHYSNMLGGWTDHKIEIDAIHDAPTSENVQRKVDMCIVYADGAEVDSNDKLKRRCHPMPAVRACVSRLHPALKLCCKPNMSFTAQSHA